MNSKKKIRNIIFGTIGLISLIILAAYLAYDVLGIADLSQVGTQNQMEISKREELQRYLGYEALLPRYLTLPFDVSIGINQIGNFVDVGFLLFLFLPILILYMMRRNILYSILFIASLILFTFVSISNSLVVDSIKKSRVDTIEELRAYPQTYSFGDAPIDYTAAAIYRFCRELYISSVGKLVDTISANQDYITYPVLMVLFLGICLIAFYYIWERSKLITIFTIITTIYTFYWITLSSGIIWYGYMLLVLGTILLLYGIHSLQGRKDTYSRFIRYSFIMVASLWVLTGFTSKVSNISLYDHPSLLGKLLVYPGTYKYQLGLRSNEMKVLDDFYPYVSVVFKRINADKNSLVYRIGTSFSIFIDQNDKRVFTDNQLGTFALMRRKYKTDDEITNVLLASNFKFLMVDLNTATLDNTPEKTLVKKFTDFVEYLNNNPRLRLIGTDRQVKRPNEAGEMKVYRHMFGVELVSGGSYAVFEILR